MRLDKYLAKKEIGTRKEIKNFIENANVKVNGKIVRKASKDIDPLLDRIEFENPEKIYKKYRYIMLNKPKGYICARKSLSKKTVFDLLDKDLQEIDLSPVGRLDIDTEGLLILTNDGKFLQEIISPEKHIIKKYFALVDKDLEEIDIDRFFKGIYLKDENYSCKSAKLEILSDRSCYVYIHEGRYHQVKRMLEACGKKVTYLKRVKIANLKLDDNLGLSDYRDLSKEEISNLKKLF